MQSSSCRTLWDCDYCLNNSVLYPLCSSQLYCYISGPAMQLATLDWNAAIYSCLFSKCLPISISFRCKDLSSKFVSYHYTHRFNGPLSGTTQVSRYQKGKTNLDFTEARDREWQRHQLGRMQVCNSLQTDNHASTPPLSFYRPDALPAAQPTASKHWRQSKLPLHIATISSHCYNLCYIIWHLVNCTISRVYYNFRVNLSMVIYILLFVM